LNQSCSSSVSDHPSTPSSEPPFHGSVSPAGIPDPNYLEDLDNIEVFDLELRCQNPVKWGKKHTCNPSFFVANCTKCGVKLAIPHGCFKPWCSVCGIPGGPLHKQRMKRVYQRIGDFSGSWGYMVVTFPKRAEKFLYDPKQLEACKKYVWARLKYHLHIKDGMHVYHFEGDKSDDHFPHLNFVFPFAYIKPEILDAIKSDLKWWLIKKAGMKNLKNVDLHYSYKSNPWQKAHLIRYLTRSTFIHFTPARYAVYKSLTGICYYGSWRGKKEKVYDHIPSETEIRDLVAKGDAETLVKLNRCPCCGTQINNWFFVHKNQMSLEDWVEAGSSGVYVFKGSP
jgi:hypothetical protein